jgi:hypothetical protein
MMADGRAFTDYRPKGLVTLQDIVPLNLPCFDYRMMLETDANKFMEMDRSIAFWKNVCGPCDKTWPRDIEEETCGPNTCTFQSTDATYGIGFGRNYLESNKGWQEFEQRRREVNHLLKNSECYVPPPKEENYGGRLVQPYGLTTV